MLKVEYDPSDYETLDTQDMDPELSFKLVRFKTGYIGIISYSPTTGEERVILVSPEKCTNEDNIFDGLGCKSFLVFARDAKKYMENAPRELVVVLGKETPVEYREIITCEGEDTLRERVELVIERMEIKMQNSFHYKYGEYILTFLMCISIFCSILAILNLFQLGGL